MRPPTPAVPFAMLLLILAGCSSPQTPPSHTGAGQAEEQAQSVDAPLERPQIIERVEPDRSKFPNVRARGVCILEAFVTAGGRVGDVRVVKSVHPDVDTAAVEALRQWTFRPATRQGKAVAVYYTVTINIDWH